MNYTIHQLKIFLSIAKLGSITRAAEELHLTQPAVSIQLKNLQDQFDIPLTEHVGRKIFITGFGHEVADAAQRILDEVDNLGYRVSALKGKLSGRLRISVVSTGKYVMPYFLSGFLKENDGVDIELDVTNKSKVVESLKNNDVDFSLVSVLPEKLKVNTLGLLPNKLFLIGNRTSFRSKSIQDKSVFQDLPLIFREQGSGTRLVMERFMKTNRIPFRKKMELTGNEAVKQAVISGMGYSVMPLIGIKNELLNGELQIIPVKGFPIRSEWNLVWIKDKGFSTVASAFIQYMKRHRTQVIRESFSWYDKY